MSRVADVVAGLGHEGVWTHINSGNVVFDATGRREALERQTGAPLEDEFGFEITTFVRSAAELRAALEVEPFSVAEGDTYFITFLKEPPSDEVAGRLEAASNDVDTLVVHGRDVHWRMHGPSPATTVKASTWTLVGRLGSTSRNVNMLRRLSSKIDR